MPDYNVRAVTLSSNFVGEGGGCRRRTGYCQVGSNLRKHSGEKEMLRKAIAHAQSKQPSTIAKTKWAYGNGG